MFLPFHFGLRGSKRGRAGIQFDQHGTLLNVLAFHDVHLGHDAGGGRGELRAGGRCIGGGRGGFNHAVGGDVMMQGHALERAGLNADDRVGGGVLVARRGRRSVGFDQCINAQSASRE